MLLELHFKSFKLLLSVFYFTILGFLVLNGSTIRFFSLTFDLKEFNLKLGF
jgi:hypothetical protein